MSAPSCYRCENDEHAACGGPESGCGCAAEGHGERPRETTVLDLEAIKGRLAKATPGPWEWRDCYELRTLHDRGSYRYGELVLHARDIDGDLTETEVANRDFVAAAREDIAALVAEVERLRAQESVRGGEWCAQNRAEGRGGCGCCAWCCQQQRDRAEKAEAEVERLREASRTRDDQLMVARVEARRDAEIERLNRLALPVFHACHNCASRRPFGCRKGMLVVHGDPCEGWSPWSPDSDTH